MKPYLIVCWDCHYPLGGLNNVKDSANSLEEAKEIANEILISDKTVSTYRTRILGKMGLKNNAELTIYAIRNDLLE